MKEKKYTLCQSCTIPLKLSPNGGGSNKDGSLSTKYCAFCYENGDFIDPDYTMEDMQSLVKGYLLELGMPKWYIWITMKLFYKIERWKKNECN